VPYQRLLDELIHNTRALGALLLDSEGEVVVESGARDERHRLIGAYQGLGLAAARRTAERYESGSVSCVVCRYTHASVLMLPLKDGYYLVASFASDAPLALAVYRSGLTQERLDREL
jgi:predicted regulator of Ras-like GTPase activity (Roadblock/LC7/MglB family)